MHESLRLIKFLPQIDLFPKCCSKHSVAPHKCHTFSSCACFSEGEAEYTEVFADGKEMLKEPSAAALSLTSVSFVRFEKCTGNALFYAAQLALLSTLMS